MNHILPNIASKRNQPITVRRRVRALIDTLAEQHELSKTEYKYLLDHITIDDTAHLFERAYEAKQPYYQNRVFLRGLIEISNHCVKGCRYCGINRNNKTLERYRLTHDEILECVDRGYDLGYRTFVLQGGEDPYFTDEILTTLIRTIKTTYPDTRITLSLGERSKDSYRRLKEAGADRYLLRHETASKRLYEHLHPRDSQFAQRMRCLYDLKDLGYQVGAGFMVGSPTQTNADLVEDLIFLKELDPHMIGIGPYLCHEDTELAGNQSGTLTATLIMVALVRLVCPKAMLPATTALGTLDKLGRENALMVGANVMMPNLSPEANKALYEIYQNKIRAKDTDQYDRDDTKRRIEAFHHIADFSAGDHVDIERMITHD